jgi:hypothetical protein
LVRATLLFLVEPTGHPYRGNEDNDTDDAELPKLTTSQKSYNGQVGQWQKSYQHFLVRQSSLFADNRGKRTEPITNDVSCVGHSAVPGIASIKLIRRGDIQKQVAEGRLETVQSKVEDVEAGDCKANGRILDDLMASL